MLDVGDLVKCEVDVHTAVKRSIDTTNLGSWAEFFVTLYSWRVGVFCQV